MLLKILLVMAAIGVALVALRLALGRSKPPESPRSRSTRAAATPLLACHVCGAMIAQTEAVMRAGKSYCSGAHADRDV